MLSSSFESTSLVNDTDNSINSKNILLRAIIDAARAKPEIPAIIKYNIIPS